MMMIPSNRLLSFLPFILLAIPLAEIAVFIAVGRQIGLAATLLLVVATAVAGSILLRIQGLGTLGRIRQALAEGAVPGRDLVHGALIVLAGFLLITPGFITDLLGLLLFVPGLRDRIHAGLRHSLRVVEPGGFRRDRAGTIDLGRDDYSADGS